MTTIDQLEKRIKDIESRNRRVTADKAWEVSLTRRLCIAALTYVVVAIFLISIHKDQPFINALVPVIGYILSTLALAQIKSEWIQRLLNRAR